MLNITNLKTDTILIDKDTNELYQIEDVINGYIMLKKINSTEHKWIVEDQLDQYEYFATMTY